MCTVVSNWAKLQRNLGALWLLVCCTFFVQNREKFARKPTLSYDFLQFLTVFYGFVWLPTLIISIRDSLIISKNI